MMMTTIIDDEDADTIQYSIEGGGTTDLVFEGAFSSCTNFLGGVALCLELGFEFLILSRVLYLAFDITTTGSGILGVVLLLYS